MNNRLRTRTLALLGLGVVLILAALILWRPFASSSPSQSNPSLTVVSQSETVTTPTAPPERVVHFPEDRSIGELYVRDWNSDWNSDWGAKVANEWTPFGEAEGSVAVPFGKDLRLLITRGDVQDLSFLAEIGEHDLQSLQLHRAFGGRPHTPNWTNPNLTATDGDLRFIGKLRSLRELRLVGGEISDFGFTHLSGLTSLETLLLYAMDISDAGMEQIGNLTSIIDLEICNSSFSDRGLAEIWRLPLLRRLALWGNPRISDAGIKHLQSLARLQDLDLRSTRITDKGLTHLQSMQSLTSLELASTPITDKGLTHLQSMQSLTSLDLRSTRITDKGLTHLQSMRSLTSLDLTSTPITDKGLAYLQSMRSLTSLALYNTQITSEGLASLKQALPDCQVLFGGMLSFGGGFGRSPTPTPTPSPQVPVS